MTTIKRRLPVGSNIFIVVISILGLCAVYTILISPLAAGENVFSGKIWPTIVVVSVLLTINFFIARSTLSYLIRYDDSAVYQNPAGKIFDFKFGNEEKIEYSEIHSVIFDWWFNLYKTTSAAAREPFIRIYRKDWDGNEVFAICGEYIDRAEMKKLVKLIYERRPDAFSQEVIDYINGDSLVPQGTRHD